MLRVGERLALAFGWRKRKMSSTLRLSLSLSLRPAGGEPPLQNYHMIIRNYISLSNRLLFASGYIHGFGARCLGAILLITRVPKPIVSFPLIYVDPIL